MIALTAASFGSPVETAVWPSSNIFSVLRPLNFALSGSQEEIQIFPITSSFWRDQDRTRFDFGVALCFLLVVFFFLRHQKQLYEAFSRTPQTMRTRTQTSRQATTYGILISSLPGVLNFILLGCTILVAGQKFGLSLDNPSKKRSALGPCCLSYDSLLGPFHGCCWEIFYIVAYTAKKNVCSPSNVNQVSAPFCFRCQVNLHVGVGQN